MPPKAAPNQSLHSVKRLICSIMIQLPIFTVVPWHTFLQSQSFSSFINFLSEPTKGYNLFLGSECVSENVEVKYASTPLACSWRCNLLDLACQGFVFESPHLCMLKHTCNETLLTQNGTVDTYIKYKGGCRKKVDNIVRIYRSMYVLCLLKFAPLSEKIVLW